jgi:aminoglycoside phosphotransferase (APT) family kinase protein
MAHPPKHDVRAVGAQFQLRGEFVSATPHGSGHINDSYAATYRDEGRLVRYIHQRINHHVFKNPLDVMENIVRVTEHQRRKLEAAGRRDIERRALTLVPANDGRAFAHDSDGNTWRTYFCIEGAKTHDSVQTPAQTAEAAKAFGEFQKQLTDLPGARLHETIPDFHHTPKRFEALVAAIESDACNRAKDARPEIEFVLAREPVTCVLVEKQAAGVIPERTTHNDTKINNVMFDDRTKEGICVIDLDTVMPGLVLYDFGDLVRTATSPAREDERDLALVRMQMPMFQALVDGYLASAGEFLTPAEKEHLAFSGRLITLEIGIRFLTDFLQGDTYFKIHHEGHNLDRARTQFRLVESIEEQEDAMNEAVRAWTGGD